MRTLANGGCRAQKAILRSSAQAIDVRQLGALTGKVPRATIPGMAPVLQTPTDDRRSQFPGGQLH